MRLCVLLGLGALIYVGAYRYKAFISYSHKDRAWAKWLLRRIESYSFPKHLIGSGTSNGTVPKNLKPVFRDREELSVGHNLGEKIEAALNASENLIIICSPNSAKSHWVNQEIIHFKRYNRDANILSVIIDGEPFSTNHELECFPPALKVGIDENGVETQEPAEPLAADFRAGGDGKRLGVLKLISGMVGLGVNDLIQRDLQRAKRRVMAITASAAAIVLAMGTMTYQAIDSRNQARFQRVQAEELITFVVLEHREDIIGTVGNLPILTDLNLKLAEYYEDIKEVSNLPPESIELNGLIIEALGEDEENKGNKKLARQYYKDFNDLAESLHKENPQSPEAKFYLAVSENRLGLFFNSSLKYEKAITHLERAQSLLKASAASSVPSARYAKQAAYVNANLCHALLRLDQDLELALEYCSSAIEYNHQLIAESPNEIHPKYDLVYHYLILSQAYERNRKLDLARQVLEASLKETETLVRLRPNSMRLREQKMEVFKYFGDKLSKDDHHSQATPFYREAYDISKLLILVDPTNNRWMKYYKDLGKIIERKRP